MFTSLYEWVQLGQVYEGSIFEIDNDNEDYECDERCGDGKRVVASFAFPEGCVPIDGKYFPETEPFVRYIIDEYSGSTVRVIYKNEYFIRKGQLMALKTQEVKDRLHAKYGKDGSHAIFFEVPNGTGMRQSRTADAITMSLWPSRGLDITGFEIKVSRGDWQKELKQPEKGEFFWQQCDYWALCVGDATIVKSGELPKGWGLMTPHGDGLRWKVQPERLERPSGMSRDFIAGIFRAASKYSSPDERDLARKLREARQAGNTEGREHEQAANRMMIEEHARLQQTVREFEEASGFRIKSQWDRPVKDVNVLIKAIRLIKRKDLKGLVDAVKLLDKELPVLKQLFNQKDDE